MTLWETQERVLKEAAQRTGRLDDLLCYYAVAGEWERFHDIGRTASEANLLTYRLFGLAQSPEHADWVLACIAASDDLLHHYALTKFLLGRGDLKNAIAAVRRLLERHPTETLPLNLVARYAARNGHEEVALKLLDKSLSLNPDQKDAFGLRERVSRGGRDDGELYLGVLPKRVGVTFYTPAYNVEQYLRETLEALVAQNYPLEEILVINDGSRDASAEIAREFPVRLIDFGENRGLAAARNAAFHEATTPFVGSVDADVCADPGYTTHILMEFENAAPELAAVGGRLVERFTDTPADFWRARYLPQGWYPVRMYFEGFPLDTSAHVDSRHCDIFFLNGCNNIFRREALLAAGGYNEKYRTNSEDAAICVTLRKQGAHLAFARSAITRHSRRDTPKSVLRTAWNYGRWSREEEGMYNSAQNLLTCLHYPIAVPLTRVEEDCKAGLLDCAYIDILVLFHWPLLDLAYAVEKGALSKEQAAYMQASLLELAGELDGGLGECVLRDSVHLLIEEKGDRESLTPEMLQVWEMFTAMVRRYFGTLPEQI